MVEDVNHLSLKDDFFQDLGGGGAFFTFTADEGTSCQKQLNSEGR